MLRYTSPKSANIEHSIRVIKLKNFCIKQIDDLFVVISHHIPHIGMTAYAMLSICIAMVFMIYYGTNKEININPANKKTINRIDTSALLSVIANYRFWLGAAIFTASQLLMQSFMPIAFQEYLSKHYMTPLATSAAYALFITYSGIAGLLLHALLAHMLPKCCPWVLTIGFSLGTLFFYLGMGREITDVYHFVTLLALATFFFGSTILIFSSFSQTIKANATSLATGILVLIGAYIQTYVTALFVYLNNLHQTLHNPVTWMTKYFIVASICCCFVFNKKEDLFALPNTRDANKLGGKSW